MAYAIGVLRVEDGRSVGQRVVHHLVLDKVISLMNDLGEKEIVLACRRWRDGPGMVPKGTALEQALKKADAHRQTFVDKGMPGEAAYCEIAAFCVQSCMDEAGAAS